MNTRFSQNTEKPRGPESRVWHQPVWCMTQVYHLTGGHAGVSKGKSTKWQMCWKRNVYPRGFWAAWGKGASQVVRLLGPSWPWNGNLPESRPCLNCRNITLISSVLSELGRPSSVRESTPESLNPTFSLSGTLRGINVIMSVGWGQYFGVFTASLWREKLDEEERVEWLNHLDESFHSLVTFIYPAF